MSGCNCKNKNIDSVVIETPNNEGITSKVIKYFAKIIGFGIALIIVPFITLYTIWLMFDVIVLSNNMDLGKILTPFLKISKLYDKLADDEDDEEEDLTEEDVVMVNVEDITNKIN